MSDLVISVENLGKKYRIRHQQQGGMRYKALRDVLADGTKSVARRLWSVFRGPWSRGPVVRGLSAEDFWALKDISFEVRQGETLGIIGRNGAGKSTLLKILSRITEPTEGRVRIRGRVASLLEVGTGFHPELTGRENVFLNGAILGMTRAEIRRKFDEIVGFAEIEKFLDTPVKRYSSGMYVRLAFAVAAHLEPEILIVDEVLAVGDAEFQKKCLGKMKDIAGRGRTVLFVSHNIGAVQALTTRCFLLREGRLVSGGPTAKVIEEYTNFADASLKQTNFRNTPRASPELGRRVRIFRIEPLLAYNLGFRLGEDIVFRVSLECNVELKDLRFGATITDINDSAIISLISNSDLTLAPGECIFEVSVRDSRLTPGTYGLSLSIGQGDFTQPRRNFDVVRPGPSFAVAPVTAEGITLLNWSREYGAILHPKSRVDVRLVESAIPCTPANKV